MNIPQILDQLEKVRKSGRGWTARCPAHEDKNNSLSIGQGDDGRILLKCFAGCTFEGICAAKGWKPSDLFAQSNGNQPRKSSPRIVAEYPYADETGKLLFQNVRYEPKDFRQRRPDGNGGWAWNLDGVRRVLYRLPEVMAASDVLFVEGEKDADTGEALGLTSTTSGGAESWRAEFSETLRGKRITIISDADVPGRKHAQRVAESLHSKAASVKVIELPGAKDLSEWVEHGGTREALLDLIHAAPEWTAQSVATLLDELVAFVRRFVSLSLAQALVIALWIAHTHGFDAANCTPYLAVNSAEKQSGKTRLLEILRLLVFCAWFTGRVTAAVLIRKIHAESPTLLLDESDAAFRGEETYAEALRGILNTGYRRGGAASCCVGQGAAISYKDFSTFCPKAIAGIGKLPDTVADRSILIRLKRARRGEVARFREREAQREGSEIAARLAAWSASNVETLRQARPDIPAQLSDRQADCCEPLLAIADLAGGEWPEAARKAIVKLCGQAQVDDDSIGVQLLRDIKDVFGERQVDELASADLTDALAKIEVSPWGEWSHGKPLSPMKLARLLKPFEIFPGQIRNGQARGYRLEDFQGLFSLYLPPQGVKVSETLENIGDSADLKVSNDSPPDTLENAVSVSKNAASRHLDTLKHGGAGKRVFEVEV